MKIIAIKHKRNIKWCRRAMDGKECAFLSSSGYFDSYSGVFFLCLLEDEKEIGSDYFNALDLPEKCMIDVKRNELIDKMETISNDPDSH